MLRSERQWQTTTINLTMVGLHITGYLFERQDSYIIFESTTCVMPDQEPIATAARSDIIRYPQHKELYILIELCISPKVMVESCHSARKAQLESKRTGRLEA